MEYNFIEIERKWQDWWAKNKTYKAQSDSAKPKYYVLDMFPYPSGAACMWDIHWDTSPVTSSPATSA